MVCRRHFFRGGLKWQAAFIVMEPESIANGFRLQQKSWFNVFKPLALGVALAKRVSAHVEAVDSGKISSPAYQRKDGHVVANWRDTRLEALRHLWNYGTSESVLLADTRHQRQLLDAFFKNIRAHEFPPRPSGDSVSDTLQALFQVYLYLYEAGMMVADSETMSLRSASETPTPFGEFERRVNVLRAQWIVYEDAVHASGAIPKMPCTLLEVLYSDVTRRAKSIAFSATYGPSYRFTWDHIEGLIIKELQEQGESQDNIDKKLKHARSIQEKLLDADDPDQLLIE